MHRWILDYFRVVCIGSKKPEKEIVEDILKALDSKLRKEKFSEPNDFYRFVKSVKCEGKIKIFIKTKNIPEYFTVIKTLQSKNIEITKMPRWDAILLLSLSSFLRGCPGSTKLNMELHIKYLIYLIVWLKYNYIYIIWRKWISCYERKESKKSWNQRQR